MGAVNVLSAKYDNALIALEKSFSVAEVKEIIAESQKEHNKVIEGAKNYIIRMTEEKKEVEEANEQLIKEGEKKINEKLSEQTKENNEKINNLKNSLTKEKAEAEKKLETEKNRLILEKEGLEGKLANFHNKEKE